MTLTDQLQAALEARKTAQPGGELPLFIEGGKARKWGQAEVNFQAISPQLLEGRACLTCRYYNGLDNRDSWNACSIVDSYPRTITALGVSDKYEPLPSAEYVPEPRPVYIVEPPEDYDDDEKGLLADLKRLIAGKSQKPSFELDGEQGFKIKGNTWVGYWSNNARDKENEVFPTVAIDNYINAVRAGTFAYPELWLAHIPGTRHGVAKHVGRIDNVVYAIGEFDSTASAKELRKVYKRFPNWKMSHGFYYIDRLKINGIYLWFKTYEISSLPAGLEANDATEFSEEGLKMGLDQIERTTLEGLGFSPEFIKQLESGAAKVAAPIIAEGRETKQFDPAAVVPATPAVTQAAPVPAAQPAQPPVSPTGEKGMNEWAAFILSVNKAQTDLFMSTLKAVQDDLSAQKQTVADMLSYLGLEEAPATQSVNTVVTDPNAAALVAANQRGAVPQRQPGELADTDIMPWLREAGGT